MTTPDRIVIVGAGQAGGWVARTLRSEGHRGRIDLVGDEDRPPYERPPLSKAVLTGEAAEESTYLFRDEFPRLEVSHHRRVRAVAIDRAARTVECDNGTVLPYDRLVLATGSRPRELTVPGAHHPRVVCLRTLADCARIRPHLEQGRRLVIIGGGWIGLEVAASARRRGVAATVLEAADRLCGRALPPELSSYLLDLHRGHDVDVRLGAAVESLHPREAAAVDVVVSGGETLTADLVVVGIGVLPNVELAESAGLAVDNGIITDAEGRTADANVLACGDVTCHDNRALGRRVRLESWSNAQNQAIAAARVLLGQDARYEDIPWFWSDQYDMNLQMLGLADGTVQPVIRGDRESGSFSAFYQRDGLLVSVIAVNSARVIGVARRLMQRSIAIDPARLSDSGTPLQELLKA